MKKMIFTLVLVMLCLRVFCQEVVKQKAVPHCIHYQGNLYDTGGVPLSNKSVAFQMTIRSGTPDGEVVYSEIHNVFTNSNGTVNFAIGGGAPFTGCFDTINWYSGNFFLEVAVDAIGGGIGKFFEVLGVTQFFSVPYAFHSATADSLTGYIIENDPIFLGSVSAGITASDTTFWNQKQDQILVGPGLQKNNNVISLATYEVGDWANGGIVFWVDETGQHGLVCEKGYFHGVQCWWIPETEEVKTCSRGDGPLSGEMNTAIIIAVHTVSYQSDVLYAARLCADLQATEAGKTYGDWYLPSKNELELMHSNMNIINSTALAHSGYAFMTCPTCWYWSSTEIDLLSVWVMHFALQQAPVPMLKESAGCIRAVRAF